MNESDSGGRGFERWGILWVVGNILLERNFSILEAMIKNNNNLFISHTLIG